MLSDHFYHHNLLDMHASCGVGHSGVVQTDVYGHH